MEEKKKPFSNDSNFVGEQEIEKTLLIIKSNPRSLTAVETFLRNRDWEIKTTSNVKDALLTIIQKKPKFVMVSVDHPNKKVKALPKILIQTFPVCVILFGESSNSVTYRNLKESGSEYILFPPVTGPAIERIVFKYYRDQEDASKRNAQIARTSLSDEKQNSGNDFVSIKGDSEVRTQFAENSNSELSSTGLAAFLQQMGEDSDGANFAAGGVDTKNVSDYFDENPDKKNKSKPADFDSNYTAQDDDWDGGAWERKKNVQAWQPLEAQKKNKSATSDAEDDFGSFNNQQRVGQGGTRRGSSVEDVDPEKDPNSILFRGPRSVPGRSESILIKGTQEALDKSSILGDRKIKNRLQGATNVACILIESNRFNGYLIAALGFNKNIDDEFLNSVQKRLFTFLRANGENVASNKTLDLKIQQVDFEGWALEYAEFLRKSIHSGDEVAMAFFPATPVNADVGESAHVEMGSIDIDDLHGDLEVEFNVYIYLPVNKKYVLYTPRKGKFYDSQKTKLKKQGIKQMHIFKEDVMDLTRYRVQNFLNAKVQDYEALVRVRRKKSS